MLYRRDLVIKAGDSVYLHGEGDFCRYRFGLGASGTAILIKADNGAEVDMMVGESFKLPQSFTRLQVMNPNAADLTLSLLVGYGTADGSSNVVVSNTLSIADVSVSRVKDGRGFFCAVALDANTQFQTAELWNPTGSGRVLAIRRVIATTNCALGLYNVALGALVAGAVTNKRPDMAAPAGVQGRKGVIADIVSAPPAGAIAMPYVFTTATIEINSEPLIVPEGYGLIVQNRHATLGASVTVDGWVE